MSLSDDEVREEMESWRGFAESLRADDRELFREMMRLCHEYAPAMNAKDSPSRAEPLFMSLLLVQHKAIARLVREIQELKGGGSR